MGIVIQPKTSSVRSAKPTSPIVRSKTPCICWGSPPLMSTHALCTRSTIFTVNQCAKITETAPANAPRHTFMRRRRTTMSHHASVPATSEATGAAAANAMSVEWEPGRIPNTRPPNSPKGRHSKPMATLCFRDVFIGFSRTPIDMTNDHDRYPALFGNTGTTLTHCDRSVLLVEHPQTALDRPISPCVSRSCNLTSLKTWRSQEFESQRSRSLFPTIVQHKVRYFRDETRCYDGRHHKKRVTHTLFRLHNLSKSDSFIIGLTWDIWNTTFLHYLSSVSAST